MGTRHLTCVVLDGEYAIAQYGQWDGYPSGQGTDILDFLKKDFDKDLFLKELKSWKTISSEEANAFPENSFPNSLNRDTGSKILQLVQDGEVDQEYRVLYNNIKFAQDSLFCEWAYVLNLDTDELEVFQGCNTTPLSKSERFYNKDFKAEETGHGNTYYQARLLHIFDINNLPFSNEFVEILEPGEEEEDNDGLDMAIGTGANIEPEKPTKSKDEADKALVSLSELAKKEFEIAKSLLTNQKIPASPELSQLQDIVERMYKQNQKYLKTIKALGFRFHMLDDEDGFNIAWGAIETEVEDESSI